MRPKTVLRDKVTFQNVKFVVKVEERKFFINRKTGMIRMKNMAGHPKGMSRTPRNWMMCEGYLARVRPDYRHTTPSRWPENVDKHFHDAEPTVAPTRRSGWFPFGWTTAEREPERTPQELAEDTIEKMKTAYREREKVQKLDQ